MRQRHRSGFRYALLAVLLLAGAAIAGYLYYQSLPKPLADELEPAVGEAAYDHDLGRFEQGTYRLSIVTQGFEAGDGRSVSAGTSTLVSPVFRLIGYRADGELGYLNKGSERHVAFIGIDPSLKPVAFEGLSIRLVERQYVSTLVRQSDGTYRFQSVEQRRQHHERPFSIPEAGTRYRPSDRSAR